MAAGEEAVSVLSRNTVKEVGRDGDRGEEEEYTPFPPFQRVQLVLLAAALAGVAAVPTMREVSEPPGTKTQGSAMSSPLSPVFSVRVGSAGGA